MVKTYQVYAGIDGFIFFLAFLFSTISHVLDWWSITGDTKALSLTTAKADMGVWTMSLVIVRDGEDIKLGEDGTYEATWTWDEACLKCLEESDDREEPGSCLMIKLLQALTLVVPILAFFATGFLLISICTSKLVLVLAVICGVVSAVCSLLGTLVALSIETEGLGGSGFALYAFAVLLIWVGAAFAVQTATMAMPEPQEAAPKYMPRFERAAGGSPAGGVQGGGGGGQTARSGSSGSETEKSPPTHLQQVLFWSKNQDPGDVATRQNIPTEMLEMAFQEIDEDNSGFIVVDELVEALHMCGLNAHPKAVDMIIQDMDKNASGDIDIVEFVEFFRQLEDLSQFHHKAQARAQFCTILCNACFLLNLVAVFVLIMLFVDMDKSDNPDLYQIVNTLLIAMMIGLCVLFMCVIGMPALRLSFGRHASGWIYFYEQMLIERNTLKPVQGVGKALQEQEEAKGEKLRTTAQNAAGNQQVQVSPMLALPGIPPTIAAGMLQDQREDEPPPGVIADRAGNFIRYDPASYSRAAVKAIETRQPRNFNPMHARAVEELPGDPDLNPAAGAMKALPGSTTQWKSTPWVAAVEDRPKGTRNAASLGNEQQQTQAPVTIAPLPALSGGSTSEFAPLSVEDVGTSEDRVDNRLTEKSSEEVSAAGSRQAASSGSAGASQAGSQR